MNEQMVIDVCAGANERFMIGATAAFAGIAANAKRDTALRFHIFTEGVKPETVEFMRSVLKRLHDCSEVIEHVCDDKLLEGLPYWAGSRLSAARVFYPYLLKDLDWALYVDCDVLYFSSPEEHWSYRKDECYVCVTQEEDVGTRQRECKWAKERCGVDVSDEEYFNAGVMLFNLRKCREDRMPDKIQQFYKDYPDVRLPDQTAMNTLFAGRKVMLPPKFDRLQIYLTDDKLAERPVVHYVSGNPWMPKMGVVANGRFRMWHRFCDKYIWQGDGLSLRRSFGLSMRVYKYAIYLLLKMPCIGLCVAIVMQSIGKTSNGRAWRSQQLDCDCSTHCIDKVLSD